MGAKKYAKQESERPAEVQWIEMARLVVDHVSYQRPFLLRVAQAMAAHWDDVKGGVLIVNRRANGTLVIIDGQHRFEALRLLGRKFAPCLVYEELTVREEAEVFWKANTDRRRVRNDVLFHARLTAQDPVALDIEEAITSHGFHRTTSGDDRRGLAALAALERIYQWGGRALLNEVLDTLNGVWRDDMRSRSGVAMQGLGFFLHRYRGEPNFDPQRLLDILAVTPIVQLIKKQREIQENRISGGTDTNGAAFAKSIREFYNNRLGAARKLPPINQVKGRAA